MPSKLPKFLNQNGAIPLLVLIAVVGALAFLAISSAAPFKDGLFGNLYPKPPSEAATTFLETFDGAPSAPTPVQNSNWISRWDVVANIADSGVGPANNTTMSQMSAHHGTDCAAIPTGGTAPNPALITHSIDQTIDAVFQCRDHMMTAVNAGYMAVYLTPNHMIDFSAGEAVLKFDMSTWRASDRDWVDVWVTPFNDNFVLPLEQLPPYAGPPQRSIQLRMDNSITGPFFRVRNYINGVDNGIGGGNAGSTSDILKQVGLTHSAARRDTFELRISRNHVKFCLVQANTNPPIPITTNNCWADSTIADLGWDKAIVQLGHHTYSQDKGSAIDASGPNTWHWDNVSISPALPFTMIKGDKDAILGKQVQSITFTQPAPANAFLRFAAVSSFDLSFDGGVTWQPATRSPLMKIQAEHFQNYWTPIPQGVQTIHFRGGPATWTGSWVARHISIWSDNGTSGGPLPSLNPTPIPSVTASPSAAPTVIPTPTPTPTPTPVPTIVPSCPASGGNLLQNNGFECGSTGWQGTTNGGRSIVATPTHTGTKSQQMLASSVFPRQITQSVPVTPGNSYALSGWINTNGIGGPGASIQVNWLSGTGAILSTNTTSVLTGSNNWTQLSSVFTAPANSASAQVTPTLAVEPDNTGTAWFDDISLTQSAAAPTPTPTATSVPTATPAPSKTPTPTPVPTATPVSSVIPTPVPSKTPVPSPTGKLGDVNGDNKVNFTDLSYIFSKWGTSDAKADLNKDGIVNIADFSILIANWGK